MKKVTGAYLMIVILMVSTIGVNISVHWCGDAWTGIYINGVEFLSDAGQAMKNGGCCEREDDCAACHHVDHQYQITSQYVRGQGVDIAPSVSSGQWLAGILPKIHLLYSVEEGSTDTAEYHYPPPLYQDATCSRRGLRAPPVLA